MTTGILAATNAYGNILLSSDVTYPHFLCKLTMKAPVEQFTKFSKSISFRYALPYALPTNVVAIPFIKPAESGAFHVIISTSVVGGIIEYVVSKSGASNPPTLYIFTKIHTSSSHVVFDNPSPSYGLRMITDNNNISFDTRLKPLRLEKFYTEVAPRYPASDGPFSTLDTVQVGYVDQAEAISKITYNFNSDDSFNTYSRNANDRSADMFSYQGYPQAVAAQRLAHYHKKSGSWLSSDTHYFGEGMYAVHYRSAMRLSASSVECGWLPTREYSTWRKYHYGGGLFGWKWIGYSSSDNTTLLGIPIATNDMIAYIANMPLLAFSGDYD